MLAALGLREQAILLDFARKTLEGSFERLALFDQDFTHYLRFSQSGGDATNACPHLITCSFLRDMLIGNSVSIMVMRSRNISRACHRHALSV